MLNRLTRLTRHLRRTTNPVGVYGNKPDGMPADWPHFTADVVPDAWEHVDRVLDTHADEGYACLHPADEPCYTSDPARDAADHMLAKYRPEHPTVTDLRRTLDHITNGDPLHEWVARRLTHHDEAIAYEEGARCRADSRALTLARYYLDAERDTGARLAALVLAGYTGTPREDVA